MSHQPTAATTGGDHGRRDLAHERPRWLGAARLGIGLIWGLALWWLYRSVRGGGHLPAPAWPATDPNLFGPLLLLFAYLPVVALASVGRLRLKTGAIWLAVVAVALLLLGLHDVTRQAAETLRFPPYLTAPMLGFVAVALFIAHHLVAPADAERRWIASFPAYFDQAWKAGVQLALSLGFTGAFWLLLHLGAALFRIIGLKFLQDLITQDWFALPVTGLVFALAVHLADVRDGLIRGVRTVGLMLLSWLLLVMTVLVAAFLIALPFTGLKGLWETGSATALVLAAAAALIVLINTAYQDGRPDNLPPAVLRVAVRVAAVLIAPLILIAFWGLSLRIGQHGLTPDRIIAFACALVGAAYAVGYGAAALVPMFRRGSPWMKALETTNIAVAVLEVAVILALFSPLADPARLSVNDQMKRLESGKVSAEAFDYRFLRFDSGKAGQAALDDLTQSSDRQIADHAARTKANNDRYGIDTPPAPRSVDVWPTGASLPDGFLSQIAPGALSYCEAQSDCLAVMKDMNRDGAPEVLVANKWSIQLFERHLNGWRASARFMNQQCAGDKPMDFREAIRAGQISTVEPRILDIDVDGRQLSAAPDLDCVDLVTPPAH